jgi:ABC-type glycerol-3-phosphate transport system substrate-binding protein
MAPLSSLHAQGNTVTLQLTIPTALADVYSPKFLGEFESSHPGIKVQVNKQNASIPQPAAGLDRHFEAVQKYVTSGDVVYISTLDISAESTQARYFLDLAPLVKEDTTLNPDDFYPAVWQSYQWDQGIWVLPVSADPFVLLYNPDAFDKAGIPYPNDKWTVDDLIDAARKLTSKDADGKTKPGIDMLPYLQGFAFRAVIKSSIIDQSTVPNTPKLDTPEIADLLEKWLKLDNEGAIGAEIAKAPMSLAPAIWLAIMDQLAPGEKRSASMLPGGQAAISVDGFALSSGTQYPEQAYALAAWLTTRGESANIGLSSTPARKSLKNASGSNQLPFKLDVTPEVQAVIDQSVANAIPVSELRFAGYLAVAYNRMKNDKVDVATALQQAENDAIKAQQQAASQKDKIKNALVVATPIPSSDVAAGKIELKFAVGNNAPTLPNKDAWDKLIADFTASDPKVAKITLDVSTDALEKLAEKHDCFYLPYDGLAPEKLAKLVPLDPFTSADTSFDKADLVGGVLAQVTRDNKIYALPADIAPEVLKYDASAFEKAGVPAPGLLWTTDQFTDALKQLRTFNGDKPAFVPVNTFGSYIMNLIVAYGGMPIDYRTTPPTVGFTDPTTVDAIRQLADLAKQGYFKYHPLFGPQFDLVIIPEPSLIKTASLGAYSISALLGGGADAKTKLTLYPHGSKNTAITYGIGTLYISATTLNPEACYRWISTVAKNPNLFSSMPARRSLLDDPALAATQGADTVAVYKQIADLLQDPNIIPLPVIGAGTSANELILQLELYKALDKYLAPDSSVELESVLKDAEDSAKAFLGCSDTIPPLDMTSTDSQKAYFNAAKLCATKADPDLAPFFAGIKTD